MAAHDERLLATMTDEPIDELPSDILASLRASAEVDPTTRDAHIDRALAHFDALGDASTQGGEPSPVTPIRSTRHAARWVGIAAAVLLAVGGVWLAGRGGTPPAQTADRAPEAPSPVTHEPLSGARAVSGGATSSGAASASKVPSGSSFGAAITTTAPPPSPQAAAPVEGNAPTYAPAGQSDLAAPATTTAPTTAPRAPASICAAPRLRASLISIDTATVHGRLRLIYTYASGPDGEIITRVTLDPSTCART
jgi:hypothetical protein